jgi:hypothetical protein
MDNQIKTLASNDKYSKHLMTIPGISYYAALLISSEIADIKSQTMNTYLPMLSLEHLSSFNRHQQEE